MLGDDDLPSISMTPFLVAATLVHEEKAVAAEHSDDVVGVADWEASAQGRAISTSLVFLESLTG